MNIFKTSFNSLNKIKIIEQLKWLLKYKIFNLFVIEPYYVICSLFKIKIGITSDKRERQLIVSLTSIPERIDRVYLTIETLLQQSLKPDKIILWLSDTAFNNEYLQQKSRFTRRLLRFRKRGLTIEFCKDLRSYTKIIYSLEKFPDSVIVSADDDLYYPRDWLKELYKSYMEEPSVVHCHFANYIKKSADGGVLSHHKWLAANVQFIETSYNVFPFTGQGCLFPPGSFNKEVFNKEVYLNICPNHDDAWFKGMTIYNGIKSKKIKPISKHWQTVRGTEKKTITSIIIGEEQFNPQVKAVFDKYDLYKYLED